MRHSIVLELALGAIFTALTAVCSVLSIPLPWGVPINLAFIGLFLSAGLLGAKRGTLSVTAFILLGAAGLPVFSEFSGGLSVLFGPTGGYIFGYIPATLTAGLIIGRLGRSPVVLSCAMLLGVVPVYILGTAWFYLYYQGEHTLRQVLLWCVVPYLPGDALKIVLCTVLIPRLYPLMAKIRRQPVNAS